MESWEPSQHLLIDTGKPRKTCVEVAGRRTFRILTSSQQPSNVYVTMVTAHNRASMLSKLWDRKLNGKVRRGCRNGNTTGGVHLNYAPCNITETLQNSLATFLGDPAFCVLPSHVFTLPRCYVTSYASCMLFQTFQTFRNCSKILPGGGRAGALILFKLCGSPRSI